MTLLVGAVVASRLIGCSPGGGNDGAGNQGGNVGFGGNGFGTGSTPGTGSIANQGTGADMNFSVGDSSMGAQNGGGSSGSSAGCGVKLKPEEIIVYHDASVTDTIVTYTYSPVAIYIMQDRSSSMIGILGDKNSWPNSVAAVTAFVNDPMTAGLDVGLAVFPPNPTPSNNDQGDCAAGTDCGAPVAEIGPVPANANAIISGMNGASPSNYIGINLTPTECALRGMINHCLDWTAKSGEKCVAVLVTDGQPTTCNTDTTTLPQIVADGKAKGVLTFTIGLPGSNKAFLDDLALKGGSNVSVDVSSGSAAFIAALNAIRSKVSTSTTSVTHHTTQTVVSAPLPCEWNIPAPPMGQQFDKTKVNMTFTPKGGTAQNFGYVAVADCPRADNGWYYDNPNDPKKVFACPKTCDTLKNSTGAEVDVSFGCAQIPAVLH